MLKPVVAISLGAAPRRTAALVAGRPKLNSPVPDDPPLGTLTFQPDRGLRHRRGHCLLRDVYRDRTRMAAVRHHRLLRWADHVLDILRRIVALLQEGRNLWAVAAAAAHLCGSVLMTLAGIGTVNWLRG